MKTITTIALLAAIVFAGLYFQQSRKVTASEQEVVALQQKVGALQSKLDGEERRTARLREQAQKTRVLAEARLKETLKQSAKKSAAAADAGNVGQKNGSAANPFGKMMSEFSKNPEMKEMIKAQQKTMFAGMLDKNYAKLFSNLRLTPEQTTTFKDLLMEKQLAATDMGMSMFSDDLDTQKRAEMLKQVKETTDVSDAKIKEFLGDQNFAQFQTYEKSMPERMAVSGFQDQLGTGPNALTDAQQQSLVEAMQKERQNFKFTVDFSDKSKLSGDPMAMFTEDKINTYFEELKKLNEQYVNGAQGILSADQAASFEKYIHGQEAIQKVGMQMAAKMFAPAKQ
jgi:hypothetical protein